MDKLKVREHTVYIHYYCYYNFLCRLGSLFFKAVLNACRHYYLLQGKKVFTKKLSISMCKHRQLQIICQCNFSYNIMHCDCCVKLLLKNWSNCSITVLLAFIQLDKDQEKLLLTFPICIKLVV